MKLLRYSSFVLKQKNQKFKALTYYATKYKPWLNHLKLAMLKQQMIFNASTSILLNATKFNALASRGVLTPTPLRRRGAASLSYLIG